MRNAAGRREGFVLTSERAPPFALLMTGVIKIHCFPCCPSNGRTAATCTLARGKNSPGSGAHHRMHTEEHQVSWPKSSGGQMHNLQLISYCSPSVKHGSCVDWPPAWPSLVQPVATACGPWSSLQHWEASLHYVEQQEPSQPHTLYSAKVRTV